MDKEVLKSAISIEFGLSNIDAGNAVDNIFETLIQYFIKGKEVEIQKFGKFKVFQKETKENSLAVSFIPSKKLSEKVNGNFNNLEKVKTPLSKSEIDFINSINDNTPDELRNEDIQREGNELTEVNETVAKPKIQPQRKLVSDDLVKLHKEITETDEESEKGKNLWG